MLLPWVEGRVSSVCSVLCSYVFCEGLALYVFVRYILVCWRRMLLERRFDWPVGRSVRFQHLLIGLLVSWSWLVVAVCAMGLLFRVVRPRIGCSGRVVPHIVLYIYSSGVQSVVVPGAMPPFPSLVFHEVKFCSRRENVP